MPRAEAGQHTLLTFRAMQLLGDWTRTFPTLGLAYEAKKNGNQALVAIDYNDGKVVTIFFKLRKGDVIIVVNDVVHIPATCIKRVRGAATKCRE